MTSLFAPVPTLPESYAGRATDDQGFLVDFDAIREVYGARRRGQVAIAKQFSIGGSRFDGRTFASFDASAHQDAYNAALRAAGGPEGIWLLGPVGTGKTHLLAASVNALRERGVPAVFTTTDNMLARVKDTFDAEGSSLSKRVVEIYAEVPYLAIDDLGKGYFTAWALETLWAIVNARYEHGLPCGISSNSKPAEVMALMSSSDPALSRGLIDRLIDMAGQPITMTGKSRRGVAV